MGCGKTSFVQSLGKNRIFGDELLSVDWVTKISLTKSRKDAIRQCFTHTIVNFHYPDDIDNFELLLEKFQRDTIDNDEEKADLDVNKCNIFGENNKFDKLIVMDDNSGLAGKSNDFSNFVTVSRKFSYLFLYIFHIVYPTKSVWQMILSQTKIFNIFPSLIQLGNMLKILTNICDRETIKYQINRLYFSLSNESKNSSLTIGCRKAGPAKYRAHADNNFEQICYYDQNKKYKLFNKFLAKRMEENNNSLVFHIDRVINISKNGETKIYKAVQE